MLMIWTIADYILMIAQTVIFVNVVMSWLISFNVINTHNDIVRGLWQGLETVCEPLYRPVRKILPDFGALDLSPLVVLLVIGLLRKLVWTQIVYYPFG